MKRSALDGWDGARAPAAPSAPPLTPGQPYPLGAHWDGSGINFALVAPHAEQVLLCLFDEHGREFAPLALPVCTDGVWHGYYGAGQPGQVYGYRVCGPFAPNQGHRFNPNKLLLDPYAREIVGRYRGQDAFHGHLGWAAQSADTTDTGAIALKARVVVDDYDWEGDAPPRHALADTVIYEMHVKGVSALHPGVPEALRGTYAALAEPAILDHLTGLGVTCVSLLPVHARADEARLQAMGLSNYWGYSSIGFFAPEPRYWSRRGGSTPLSELRDMVKALHRRGIEVVLDVVYNHSAETDEQGPTLSFRGIDNALYYHLRAGDPAHYENWSGCGNCLNIDQPRVLQMVMDSLRYWVQEMHVDGFRFDLAPALARNSAGFVRHSAFFAALRQDPALARVKLIAEPWDIGPGGYQLGNFPPGWAEWNDQYRDTMRGFWLCHDVTLGQFARRFSASSDLFHRDGRAPCASINFICAHDGFTLRDLVSYNDKHNGANGEQNRDGHGHNRSWNCGAEGMSHDLAVLALRARLQRALLATLVFSQGTPMLLAGDELGQTQHGNNNAYCQDNTISWLNWAEADGALRHYVGRLIALRRRYPALRHVHWFSGAPQEDGEPDVAWLGCDGAQLNDYDWQRAKRTIAIRLSGPQPCLLLINAAARDSRFTLPPGRWRAILDSSTGADPACDLGATTLVPARSLMLAIDERGH